MSTANLMWLDQFFTRYNFSKPRRDFVDKLYIKIFVINYVVQSLFLDISHKKFIMTFYIVKINPFNPAIQ
jgi:hypothetical protein